MHHIEVDSSRTRRYPVLVASCTFALVVAGALVTSNDAAGSIPDWPLNWGRLIPPLEANIRYEFAHRALALLVTLMVAGLVWRERTKLAWAALGTVIAQAAVGALLVKYVDPAALAVVHASLAQLCFGLVVAVVARALLPAAPAILPAHARRVNHHAPARVPARRAGVPAPQALAAATALFAQIVLGAMVRHNLTGPIPHIIGAVIATALVMWAGLSTLLTEEDRRIRRRAIALLGHAFSQVAIGFGAYVARAASEGAPQPVPVTVWITVAHVAVGALTFGSAIMLAMTTQVGRTALVCATT